MKTLLFFISSLCLIEMDAISLKESIHNIEKTSLPFESTRKMPSSKPCYYLTDSEWGNLPRQMYEDLNLTIKTKYKHTGHMVHCFITNSNSHILLALRNGDSDPELGLLATFTKDGKLIDFIETEVRFHLSYNRRYIMQYRIDKDATIIVSRLNVISDKPVMFYEEFSTIHAQRIDTYYKVGDDGKFQQIKQVKFEPASYTQNDLDNEDKNFWEGKETPLPEQ